MQQAFKSSVLATFFYLAISNVWAAQPAAPSWMRAQVDAPVPEHDEKADSVLMYSDITLIVQPNGKMKQSRREVYKILRPSGERRSVVAAYFDTQSKITSMRGWTIPASGKDFEVKESDAVESAVIGVDDSQLITDTRTKLMRLPAAVPGSIVGYEIEQELRPYMKADEWYFQEDVPVREARYTLQLPAGWTFKSHWLNYPEQQPTTAGANAWQWTVSNVKAIRVEREMPPWQRIVGRMFVSFIAPDGQDSGMKSWSDIGAWYSGLARDRRTATPEIKQLVMQLTANATTTLQKIQALARFAQNDIRYVAIEIGIGGHQPHFAADIFKNRFGDCKDKATLLSVMLKEIGIESYHVIINTERGSIVSNTPPTLGFNHVILAIALPNDVQDASLLSTYKHPSLGKILFFDPTDNLTPLGKIRGELQSNYGLLTTASGGELMALPKLATNTNSVERTAQLTVDEKGGLRGTVREVWNGDLAGAQRYRLRNTNIATERIKPVESVLAGSLPSFQVVQARVLNLPTDDAPLEWNYEVDVSKYAKAVGDLLLVRPRFIGTKASGFLETKEPRENAIEFPRPQRDQDTFEIAVPNGFQVDELPPAANFDYGFASYKSKTEFVGGKLRYTRTFEIKELSVPAAQAEKLKQLYRQIEGDERNVAVLKRTTS